MPQPPKPGIYNFYAPTLPQRATFAILILLCSYLAAWLILFSGLCLICGRLSTAIIPVLMLAGFVFANIPALDKHLQEHYGNEFTHYATHTRKLIPFIY